ncbi:MAG TPA: hypothetical protein PLA94_29210, partial [Myxococcota bacterium]|nr:hypothetical protein [Myxococcota bacterium]
QVEADDVFEKPPETVSMRRSEFTITRTYLGVAEGGWENKLGSMEPAVALQLLRRIHRVEPEAALESLWSTAFYTLGPEAAGQLAHHHQAQNLQQAAATLMPADLPALRAAVAADPTNAELVYRLSVQLSAAESETLFRNFLKENPKNLTISLQLANVLGDQKRAEEALTLLDGLAPGPEVDTVRSYVLAGAGRAKEALELLPPTAEGDTAIYRARLAALAGVSIPPSTDPFVQARCSLFSNPEIKKSDLMLGLTEDQSRLVSIEWAATRDPADAWPLLRNATVLELDKLHRHVRMLLGLEFMRMGDSLLGMALLDLDSRAPDGTWEQALEPEQPLPVAYEHLPASMRAAVLFVRSRVLYSRAQIMEAERLRAAAMAEEDVPGAVHLANQYWPPPDSAPPK